MTFVPRWRRPGASFSVLAAAALAATLWAAAANAGPGNLDPSFGSGGKVTTAIGSFDEFAFAVALQADGKIVAGGHAFNGHDWDVALVRYSANGTIDATFGSGGSVKTQVGTGYDVVLSLGIQPDGKIVGAGYTSKPTDDDIAVLRYNANGTLDTSFGGTGKVVTPIGTGNDAGLAMALQLDGKIVVAGYSYPTSTADFAVVRYNADGTLDTGFGGTGFVTTPIGTGQDQASAVKVQADGKIVVAGYSSNGVDNDFAVARYNADGTLDTTFGGGNGFVTTPIGPSDEAATSIAIQLDGKILVGGTSYSGTNDDFALVRYNTDGTLDTTFAGTGIATTGVGSANDGALAIAIQADGRIIQTGYVGGGNDDFGIVRWNADGTLDTSFGGTGKVATAIGSDDDIARATAIQPDGRIVVAGQAFIGTTIDFALARYEATGPGELDPDFDIDGKVTTAIGPDASAYAVAIQPDQAIVAAGFASNGTNQDFAVARYLPNGGLDPAFGTAGIATTPIGAANDVAEAVLVQPDGAIVAVGHANTGTGDDFALVRYTAAGALDTSFGGTGIVTTPIGSFADVATAAVLQPDGKIVAAGYYLSPFDNDFAVVRYNPDGTLDATFGTGGKTGSDIGGTTNDHATSVALQPDGKIVVGGYSSTPTGNEFTLVRFDAGGTLDPSFGVGGRLVRDVGGTDDRCNAVIVQPDGKIIAAGSRKTGSLTDSVVIRLLASGAPDPSFATGGQLVVAASLFNDQLLAIALQTDGKIVLGGAASNGTDLDFVVLRTSAAGVLDPTFGFGGKETASFGASDDTAFAVALQGDGKIVAAGEAATGLTHTFALARFRGDLSSGCGNSIIEVGEQCDDGNTVSGDCCSSTCQIEPAGTICRAAVNACDIVETCNGTASTCPTDTGLPDADLDGECDASDPCTNLGGGRTFLANPPPKLIVANIGAESQAGNDSLVLRSDFVLPTGTLFSALDPLGSGARFVLRNHLGVDRVDASVPGGSFQGGGTRGWKATPKGNKFTYVDATGAPIQGIFKMVVLDRGKKSPGQVRVQVTGKKGTFNVAMGDQPLKTIVSFGGSVGATAGYCAESSFGAQSCLFDNNHTHIVCR